MARDKTDIGKDVVGEEEGAEAGPLPAGKELFGPFFDLSRLYCLVIARETAVIVDVNKAALQDLGYWKEELVGHGIAFLYKGKMPQVLDGLLHDPDFAMRSLAEKAVIVNAAGQPLKVLQTMVQGPRDTVLLTLQLISSWRELDSSSVDKEELPAEQTPRKPTPQELSGYSLDKEINAAEQQLQQTQKMEAIGTLASGIAHDFNNILGVILGFSYLAKDQLDSSDQAVSYIDHVIIAANRAKELIHQILTFSRSGKGEKIPISPSRTLKEVVHLLRAALPATIAIQSEIASDKALVLMGPAQLHQIIMNLCTNAFHALGDRGGTLTISLKDLRLDDGDEDLLLPAGDYVRLTVSDTGVGMPRETLDRVFEPYFTTRKKSEGTGLGLSVVHGIVKSCGGGITANSEPGKGSSFEIYLPRYFQLGAEEAEAQTDEMPTGNERILLVDDEVTLVEATGYLLANLGYRVSPFSQSTAALKEFEKNPYAFDLVISDITMPKLTGFDLLRRIHAIRADIPIILWTGYGSWRGGMSSDLRGVKQFLRKPILKQELAVAVRKALAKEED